MTKEQWDQITHFKPEEFACKCGCGLNNIDLEVVQNLEFARNMIKTPSETIFSRCNKPVDMDVTSFVVYMYLTCPHCDTAASVDFIRNNECPFCFKEIK